jgi:hypothetical protein
MAFDVPSPRLGTGDVCKDQLDLKSPDGGKVLATFSFDRVRSPGTNQAAPSPQPASTQS